MISDDKPLHIRHLYAHKSIEHFKDDLDFLLLNFTSVSLMDVIAFVKKDSALPENAMLLTFDDGFKEMHDIVAPILLKKGVTATFFISSDFTDNKKLCYQHKASILADNLQGMPPSLLKNIKETLRTKGFISEDINLNILSIKYRDRKIIDELATLMEIDLSDYLLKFRPYLTSEQITTLIKNGFYIGAHSIDHPLYAALSLEEQLRQTKESISFLKDKFLLNYKAFAFPHSDGNVSKEFFKEVYGNRLVDISFGTGGIISDSIKNNIQRFSLERPLIPARDIIAFQYAKKFYRIIKGSDKIKRKE